VKKVDRTALLGEKDFIVEFKGVASAGPVLCRGGASLARSSGSRNR
jgi:hypothetical protein